MGRTAADLVGRALTDLIEPCGTEDSAVVGRPAPVCYRLAGVGGGSAFYGVSSAPFTHEGCSLVLYLLDDVTLWVDLKTELKSRNLELSHLARRD